ncbi:ModE family transcriptional regulator [Sphingopyxis sp.]|jgi:molybdate transport system regulatory protein|uniref:winged helix-turn-helix domain-containing protein n=1 Tax=Sphingopyxis sp. TaxID=1908224 RepID=UPI002DE3DE9F|nr:ModE family transcriptional regulator [Sphingopyxis sp.]
MSQSAAIKIHVRLYSGDEIAMGPGKADLLDAIRAHGSISAAARALDMSYRRAWLLVDTMNRTWREPLVETLPGNASGGGARVSPFGETILAEYRALQQELAAASQLSAYDVLADALRAAPKPSQKP